MLTKETLTKYVSCKLELAKLENEIRDRVNNILEIYLKVFGINFTPHYPSNLIGTIKLNCNIWDRNENNKFSDFLRTNHNIFNITKSMFLMENNKIEVKLIRLREKASEAIKAEKLAAEKAEAKRRQKLENRQAKLKEEKIMKDGLVRKLKEMLTPEEFKLVRTS